MKSAILRGAAAMIRGATRRRKLPVRFRKLFNFFRGARAYVTPRSRFRFVFRPVFHFRAEITQYFKDVRRRNFLCSCENLSGEVDTAREAARSGGDAWSKWPKLSVIILMGIFTYIFN